MRSAAGAPDALEAAERGIDDGPHGLVVPEWGHAADGEARRVADFAPAGLANALPELRRVDTAVARTEAEHGPLVVDEHERLHDLSDVGIDGVRRLLRRAGRIRELADLHIEAQFVQAILQPLSRRVHAP